MGFRNPNLPEPMHTAFFPLDFVLKNSSLKFFLSMELRDNSVRYNVTISNSEGGFGSCDLASSDEIKTVYSRAELMTDIYKTLNEKTNELEMLCAIQTTYKPENKSNKISIINEWTPEKSVIPQRPPRPIETSKITTSPLLGIKARRYNKADWETR